MKADCWFVFSGEKLFFFQREQEMRVGELGPRGAVNIGGTAVILKGNLYLCVCVGGGVRLL